MLQHSLPRSVGSARPGLPAWQQHAVPPSLRQIRAKVAYSQAPAEAATQATPAANNVVPLKAIGQHVLVEQEVAEEAPAKLSWWQRPCPGFTDVHNVQELEAAIDSAAALGQHVVVEFYAGWCTACKASFGPLCKLPQEAALHGSVRFFKANVDADEGLFWWMKQHQIRSLPHMAVWGPGGDALISMSSSFKKMPQVKVSLANMLAHPLATRFVLDAHNVAQPCAPPQPAPAAATPAAAAAATAAAASLASSDEVAALSSSDEAALAARN